MYFVYIVKCSDNTLYTGVTTDLNRRLHEHNNNNKGAKYTKSRRPVVLLYSKLYENRSLAQKEEYRIKKLSRKKKIKIIESSMS